MWYQQTLTLSAKPRGFHLVTDEVIGQIRDLSRVKTGLLHLLLQHTSASLTLNENCDPTVRSDMEHHFLKSVPDNAPYEHDYEGADDMPSHIKSSLLGVSLMLPVHNGRLQLGTWQGSGWENIAFTVVRVKLSQRYKGNKDDNFGDTSVLHEQAGCGTKRSQRLESHAAQSGDVLFAMVKEVDARPAASLKTSPELADLLRQQHDDVRPSKHLNKAHWSTVFLDGSLPDSQIYYLVDASYLQAVELLPETIRQQLSV